MKQCQRCEYDAIRGEKYCETCKKAVKIEMRESGYLTDPRIAHQPHELSGGGEYGRKSRVIRQDIDSGWIGRHEE